jgi:uncharacterized membrane protein YeaQ/YmgE (transglycosylase-associated protein family)
MTMLGVPLLSIVIWLAVGAVCGWLETQRVGDLGLPAPINCFTGAAGACLGGMFFLRWGELVPNSPVLAPFVSGVVGAAIAMTALSLGLRLRRFS